MKNSLNLLIFLCILSVAGHRVAGADARELPIPAQGRIDFVNDIQPIFAQHCFDCHGPDLQENDFRLDQKASALAGGIGGRAILPGNSAHSPLIHFVAGLHEHGRMPPEGEGEPLAAKEIGLLRAWIDQGVSWPANADTRQLRTDHWAFQPPAVGTPPAVKNLDWVQSPYDNFVLAKLESLNVEPSPEADRQTLIRRLCLDLWGLPLPAELSEVFARDKHPDAYARLVDRLLASPHFGERWARHWLDLARYADSDGYEKDRYRPSAWRFRTWVIQAINADMPFDQFTIEQLAGDLLPAPTQAQLIATGFHRQTLINLEGGVDQEEDRTKAMLDRVKTTGTVWLGMTIECAQCHSHKYDPISQTEFYQLFAFFNNCDEAQYNFPAAGESAATFTEAMKSHQAKVAELEVELQQARESRADPFGKLKQLNDRLRRLKLKAPKSPAGWAMTFEQCSTPRPTHVFIRGDFLRPGRKVSPGTLSVLPPLEHSGAPANRLDLARWLIDPGNPLTARVVVNRIWQHLFGRGLVTTPDDFGSRGEPPSHPKLLDRLATDFVSAGWSRKRIIRQIVESATYRQSSRMRPELLRFDPQNALLARQNRFRVEAEVVRDLYLATSGLLDRHLGGPSVRPLLPEGVTDVSYASVVPWQASPAPDKYRRGLYIAFQRTIPYPSLMAFDCPDGVETAARRRSSNTPIQALTTLNDPVFVECTQAMGQRVLNDGPSDPRERLQFVAQLVLARNFSDYELDRLMDLLNQQLDVFRHDCAAAEQMAGSRVARDPATTAAWISVCSAVLNLDESLTRE